MTQHINIIRIKAVNNALTSLNEKVVFVGGATISLYPDRQVFEIRPTDDVDVIIEILNYSERTKLEERLRSIGFTHDVESGVVCRFRVQGIIVDIMPTNDPSIGFKNKWYPAGFEKAMDHKIDENTTVKILTPPYFLATKLEAFKNRGNNNGRTSHDFEDIVYVLENRKIIWDEINNSDNEIRGYLKAEFSRLLNEKYFNEWIDCHVERASPPATHFILEQLKNFTKTP